MTRQSIRHRRFIHSIGKEFVQITKNKVRHHAILFVPSIQIFSFKDKLKSLFNFKREEIPTTITHKNKLMNLTINN